MVGTDFSEYFTEPDKAREGYRRVFAEGAVTDYPLTIRRVDGALTDVLYNASVFKDATRRVQGVFAAARDVTALKQASRYARSLLEASLDPLVTISPEGKITDVNEAATLVTGVGREELVGTDFSEYFTEPDKAREGYRRVFAEGAVTDYPLTIRRVDGALTDVLYNASCFKDAAGDVQGVFAAARDVTESKWLLESSPRRRTSRTTSSRARRSTRSWEWTSTAASFPGTKERNAITATRPVRSSASIRTSWSRRRTSRPGQLIDCTAAVDAGVAEGVFHRCPQGWFSVRRQRDGHPRRDDVDGNLVGYLL